MEGAEEEEEEERESEQRIRMRRLVGLDKANGFMGCRFFKKPVPIIYNRCLFNYSVPKMYYRCQLLFLKKPAIVLVPILHIEPAPIVPKVLVLYSFIAWRYITN